MRSVLADIAQVANITTWQMPRGIRLRQCGDLKFVFNYGDTICDLSRFQWGQCIFGELLLAPSGVSIFKHQKQFCNSVAWR